jgi:hypothetical protein
MPKAIMACRAYEKEVKRIMKVILKKKIILFRISLQITKIGQVNNIF